MIALLKGGPVPAGARVRLVAALLASGHPVGPELAAAIARPHEDDGEEPLAIPASSLTALDWLDGARGMRPSVPGAALRDAAAKLRGMAQSDELADGDRLALEKAAAATAIDAARVLARGADAEGAIAVLDGEGDRLSAGARALGRSSAWYLAADPARALAEIDREPEGLAADPALLVVFRIQRAELLASTGRRDEAAREAAPGRRGGRDARRPAPRPPRALDPRGVRGALVGPGPAGGRDPLALGRNDGHGGRLADARRRERRDPRGGPLVLGGREARVARGPPRRPLRRRPAAPRARRPRPSRPSCSSRASCSRRARATWRCGSTRSRRPRAARSVSGPTPGPARRRRRFRGDAAAAARWTERYRALVEIASRPDDAELAAAVGL